MPNVFRGAQAQVNRSDLSGRRVWKGAARVDWSVWFDHFWQAKGAADYATSLLDLVGAQNLVEGAGGVPWAGGTGWGFVAAFAQWLDTGLTPVNDQSWSMMVQFTNVVGGLSDSIAGYSPGGGTGFILVQNGFGTATSGYNGGVRPSAGAFLAGNQCVAGNVYYKDAGFVGPIAAGGPAFVDSVYIGALNNLGVAGSFCTADIIALGIKKGPALTAPQVAAAAAAMAAL